MDHLRHVPEYNKHVCVEYGRREWPITMLNHTDRETNIPGTEK